jgi:hemerythrin superfamily protein
MGSATEDRAKAATLPEGDVIRVLLEQHARVHDCFSRVTGTTGEDRKAAFDELRMLLAVHETAEEEVLRPVTKKVAGEDVADARNDEEKEANKVLSRLEDLDCDSVEFDSLIRELQASVTQHAENEESEEFPFVLREVDEAERRTMGDRLRTAERLAPTHPHPTTAGSGAAAQMAVGPFVAMVDRVRDALAGRDH